MTTPEPFDFKMFAGDYTEFKVTVKDSVTEVVVNLTGATPITFKLAKDNKSAVLVTLGLGTGVAITDAANGVLTVTLSESDTSGLEPGQYYYEIRVTDSAAKPDVVLWGNIKIRESIHF